MADYIVKSDQFANVRRTPSTAEPPIGQLPDGSQVSVNQFVASMDPRYSARWGELPLSVGGVAAGVAYVYGPLLTNPAVTPPPPPPPPDIGVRRSIGVYPLHESAEPFRSRLAGGKSFFTILDNADEAVRLARDGHDVWLRKYLPNSDYTPQQIVDAQPYVPDDVKAKIGFVINNEGDAGFGRRNGESSHDWLVRIAGKYKQVMALAYPRGYRRFAVCCMSMGTPDITDADVRAGLRDGFRDLYNRQTIDGTASGAPAEVWFDWHNYVPNESWLYDAGSAPTLLADGLENPPAPYAWGMPGIIRRFTDKNGNVSTYITPHDVHAPLLAAPRVIHPWDWFLTRHLFCFWEEMGIGFDAAIQRFMDTETGEDEGGIGGFTAHRAGPRELQRWVIRALDILCAPVVVNGIARPSPWRGGSIFTSAEQDTQWSGGYGIGGLIESPEVDATKWSRAS